ncbi:MAG: O-antigen ligase family protein [candidate division Zixibacteria bacterium]|nr:O-antigen ligase family protein [candidate division Zixibacteria bacterium]
MSQSISHPAGAGSFPCSISNRVVAVGALLVLSPLILYVIDIRPIIATGYLAGLAALVLLVNPRLSFVLFLVSISVKMPYLLDFIAIHPYDIAFALAALAFILNHLLRSGAEIRPTPLDTPFILLIMATWLSALFAYDMRESVVSSIRIVTVYLTFRFVFKYALEIGVRKLLLFFMIQTAVLSALAFIPFVLAGGSFRSFGPAGLALQYFAMTTLPMALAFLIWTRSPASRFGYGLICVVTGLGIFATQSRAPLLAVVVAVPILLFVAYRKARRENAQRAARAVKLVLIPIALLGVTVVVLGETLFGGILTRVTSLIASLQNPEGTVSTRLILWTSAIKGFLSSPIIGIGIGNMKIIHEVVPEVKLIPLWAYVKGMSAHNVLLHYLAETGLVGTSALMLLFWRGLRIGRTNLRLKLDQINAPVSVALFMAALVCFITMFYMRTWTWGQTGYILAILFGLNAAWSHQHRAR